MKEVLSCTLFVLASGFPLAVKAQNAPTPVQFDTNSIIKHAADTGILYFSERPLGFNENSMMDPVDTGDENKTGCDDLAILSYDNGCIQIYSHSSSGKVINFEDFGIKLFSNAISETE